MQLNDGHKLVIELNKGGFQKKLLIHIDDYLLDLTPYDHRRQELPGVHKAIHTSSIKCRPFNLCLFTLNSIDDHVCLFLQII